MELLNLIFFLDKKPKKRKTNTDLLKCKKTLLKENKMLLKVEHFQ